jgi:hypothetical protein
MNLQTARDSCPERRASGRAINSATLLDNVHVLIHDTAL